MLICVPHLMEDAVKIKHTFVPIVAAILISGCSAGGIANAMAQKAASSAISSAQENSRLASVEKQAFAQANRTGDAQLTCDEISSQLAEEAILMAASAEDLGLDTTGLSEEALTNMAVGQAALASGMTNMVPVVGGVSGMVAQERSRQKELRRNAAEAEFYGSRARRNVLMTLSDSADCT